MTEPLPGNCTTLPAIIAHQAAAHGDKTAVHWENQNTSYEQLHQHITTVAASLANRLPKGSRVAVLAWNCVEFVELLYAVPAAGMLLVPLNARLAPAEWAYQLRNCGPALLLAQDSFLPALSSIQKQLDEVELVSLDSQYGQLLSPPKNDNPHQTLPPIKPEDSAWLLYTSGSTGKPKGAVLSHKSIIAGLHSAVLGRPVLPTDKYYYPFPLFHVAAHNVLLQHAFGAAVILTATFDAQETLNACRTLGITTMSLAPTMIAMLMDAPGFHGDDLNNVRTIGYGASAMPLTLLKRLQSESSVGLCQSYGMTELCGSVAFLTVEDHREATQGKPQLLQSVGRPLATAKIKIVGDNGEPCALGEAGEILVSAAQCFSYYWANEQATESTLASNWLHTGDIGKLDEQGYLFIVDRKKDMIISGGENVASREVEEVVRAHPAIKDCAVIGLEHHKWGEQVTAVISLLEQVADAELETHCRTLLAGYKIPRKWLRAESLPVNAGGKIDKPLLRKQYGH
ncbi:MAG: class I adenylate-forming enzyme family protein [Halioglobus sp.]